MLEKLECRNLTVNGRRTSMRLEPSLWEALAEIAERENMMVAQLVSSIDRRMRDGEEDGNLTGAVRVFIATYFRRAATEEGHRIAGHGDGDPVRRNDRTDERPDADDAGERPAHRPDLGAGIGLVA